MPVYVDPHAMIWRCGMATKAPSLTDGACGIIDALGEPPVGDQT